MCVDVSVYMHVMCLYTELFVDVCEHVGVFVYGCMYTWYYLLVRVEVIGRVCLEMSGNVCAYVEVSVVVCVEVFVCVCTSRSRTVN